MKKLLLVAAAACALAACDNAAEESDEPVVEETAETMAGTYEYEMDGKPTIAVLTADGIYSDTQDGEIVESGTWEEREDGKVCFDPAGEDTPATCFTVGETDPDGTFVATPDEGEPLTIRKVS